MKKKCGNPGLRGQLIDKSVEAYILALETINRLSIKYRIETFTYLICNAWELLLKAKILSDSNNQRESIFYKTRKDKERRSISLRDGLDKVFVSSKNPIRRNVELVELLRDEATHLVISQVPKEILALFQSCVLNYHKCLTILRTKFEQILRLKPLSCRGQDLFFQIRGRANVEKIARSLNHKL